MHRLGILAVLTGAIVSCRPGSGDRDGSRNATQKGEEEARARLQKGVGIQVTQDPSSHCRVLVDDAETRAALRLRCDLDSTEGRALLSVLDLSKGEQWAAAQESAEANLREPYSLDMVFLAAVARVHHQLIGEANQDLAGGGKTALCRAVVTSPAEVTAYASPRLADSIGTLDFKGAWGTSEGSGDATYHLDTVTILAQTPHSARIAKPTGGAFWVDSRALYLERFVVDVDSSGEMLWSGYCFPQHPMSFEVWQDSLAVTFYPDLLGILKAMADLTGIKDMRFLLQQPDLLGEDVRQLPMGVGAVLNLRDLHLRFAARRHPLLSPLDSSGMEHSDYGLPPRATCGTYPHGPTTMRLCYHVHLAYSPDRKLRAYTTRPHDNLY